jgi:transcriptional regulator with XRE-family HTH domain
MTPADLRAYRLRMGWSQAELAHRLSADPDRPPVDVGTVSRWERGVRDWPAYLPLALERLETMTKEGE